jgi:hypothetical protein
MTMLEAIKIVESVGGMARQPARSTALAVWIHRADGAAFNRTVARIRAAGLKVIEAKSLEMYQG